MGIKIYRTIRRLESLSREKDFSETQVETSNQGNDTLTNIDTNVQENLDNFDLRPQLPELNQLSNAIQAWTENFEQKNNDRITKMREEMDIKLDAILIEMKSNKSSSTVTKPRSEKNDTQKMQPLGSKTNRSIGVHASYNEISYSENEDYPCQAYKMKDLRLPAGPLHRSETNLDDETLVSEEASEEDDYHMVTGVNRQLHRQSSQSSQPLSDTTGSHADRQTSTVTKTPYDPVNQIVQAIEKLANKNTEQ